VLAGASNEFRVALVDMRVTAQVFASRPNRALIEELAQAHNFALASLDVIELSLRSPDIHIEQLRENPSALKSHFGQVAARTGNAGVWRKRRHRRRDAVHSVGGRAGNQPGDGLG
jgi:hypothetical protein